MATKRAEEKNKIISTGVADASKSHASARDLFSYKEKAVV